MRNAYKINMDTSLAMSELPDFAPNEIQIYFMGPDLREVAGDRVVGNSEKSGSGSINDPRFGVSTPGVACLTCGNTVKRCPGHPARYVLHHHYLHPHPSSIALVIKYLTVFCNSCARCLVNEDAWAMNASLDGLRRGDLLEALCDLVLDNKCSGHADPEARPCAPNPVYLRKGAADYYLTNGTLPIKGPGVKPVPSRPIDELFNVIRRIRDEDIARLGYHPSLAHPRRLFLKDFYIPPPNVRVQDHVGGGDIDAPYYAMIRANAVLADSRSPEFSASRSETPLARPEAGGWGEVPFPMAASTPPLPSVATRVASLPSPHFTSPPSAASTPHHPASTPPLPPATTTPLRSTPARNAVAAAETVRLANQKIIREKIVEIIIGTGEMSHSMAATINGKKGLLRKEAQAPRVEFTARTVLSGSGSLKYGQIGIPPYVARILTKRVTVLPHNIDFLTALMREGRVNYIKRFVGDREGLKTTPHSTRSDDGRDIIDDVLYVGDVVYRQLMDGDEVFFNRQPSLWRWSIMTYTVVIMPGTNTFTLHLASVKNHNADFDGDEGTIHVVQSDQGDAEMHMLMHIYRAIPGPSGAPLSAVVFDSLTGVYLLTKEDVVFSRERFLRYLCVLAGRFSAVNNEEIMAAIERLGGGTNGVRRVTTEGSGARAETGSEREGGGTDGISAIGGAGVNTTASRGPSRPTEPHRTKAAKPTPSNSAPKAEEIASTSTRTEVLAAEQTYPGHEINFADHGRRCAAYGVPGFSGRSLFSLLLPPDFQYQSGDVVIRDGILVKGVISSKHVGTTHNSIIQALHEQYSPQRAAQFINDLYLVIRLYLMDRGFTIGIKDTLMTNQDALLKVRRAYEEVKSALAEYDVYDPDPRVRKRNREIVSQMLDGVVNYGLDEIDRFLDASNAIANTIAAGSKGKKFNFQQIALGLGVIMVKGALSIPEPGERSSIYHDFGSRDPEAFGYTSDSFQGGLNVDSFVTHAQSGRESVARIQTSVSEVGTLYRSMGLALENFVTTHVGGVMGGDRVYQSIYGNDGISYAHLTQDRLGKTFVNVEAIVTRLNHKYYRPDEDLARYQRLRGWARALVGEARDVGTTDRFGGAWQAGEEQAAAMSRMRHLLENPSEGESRRDDLPPVAESELVLSLGPWRQREADRAEYDDLQGRLDDLGDWSEERLRVRVREIESRAPAKIRVGGLLITGGRRDRSPEEQAELDHLQELLGTCVRREELVRRVEELRTRLDTPLPTAEATYVTVMGERLPSTRDPELLGQASYESPSPRMSLAILKAFYLEVMPRSCQLRLPSFLKDLGYQREAFANPLSAIMKEYYCSFDSGADKYFGSKGPFSRVSDVAAEGWIAFPLPGEMTELDQGLLLSCDRTLFVYGPWMPPLSLPSIDVSRFTDYFGAEVTMPARVYCQDESVLSDLRARWA
jgi:DNA-directed RNA polymerase beta' subunit